MQFLANNWQTVLERMGEHILLTTTALLAAAVIALPAGWLIHRRRALAGPVLGLAGALYTVPSIALIIFFLPVFGLNARSVIAALIVYCQVILLRNVLAGLDQVEPPVVEAARGMGMTPAQILLRVQLPLALPVILAGARVAAVMAVAVAAVGARFGAGGLGVFLFDGIAQAGRADKIWIGGISVALLGLAISHGLWLLERWLTPYRRV